VTNTHGLNKTLSQRNSTEVLKSSQSDLKHHQILQNKLARSLSFALSLSLSLCVCLKHELFQMLRKDYGKDSTL